MKTFHTLGLFNPKEAIGPTLNKEKDCYFMFNNVYMFEDALKFKELSG
jgi:uncharacterized protein YecE (DUF72 family)